MKLLRNAALVSAGTPVVGGVVATVVAAVVVGVAPGVVVTVVLVSVAGAVVEVVVVVVVAVLVVLVVLLVSWLVIIKLSDFNFFTSLFVTLTLFMQHCILSLLIALISLEQMQGHELNTSFLRYIITRLSM